MSSEDHNIMLNLILLLGCSKSQNEVKTSSCSKKYATAGQTPPSFRAHSSILTNGNSMPYPCQQTAFQADFHHNVW